MTSEKRYKILKSLPTYGPMYIPVSSNGPFYSEGFVVRFYKSDGTEWVANFQPGFTSLEKIVSFKDTQNLLVIARGTCYLMNPDDAIPIEIFGDDYSNIFKASEDRIVLQGEIDLTIIEPDGAHWHTERISLDGLAEIKVENSLVSGLAYDSMCDFDEWVEFTYNLDTKALVGGSYYTIESKKPWWKIW